MNSSSNAPWKDGRERSERWKETLRKGFLPRVSDGTGSPGGGGRGQPLFEFPQTEMDTNGRRGLTLPEEFEYIKDIESNKGEWDELQTVCA